MESTIAKLKSRLNKIIRLLNSDDETGIETVITKIIEEKRELEKIIREPDYWSNVTTDISS